MLRIRRGYNWQQPGARYSQDVGVVVHEVNILVERTNLVYLHLLVLLTGATYLALVSFRFAILINKNITFSKC
jgi:hypothetical protein